MASNLSKRTGFEFSGSSGDSLLGVAQADLRRQFAEHQRACPKSKLTYQQFLEVVAFENGDQVLSFPRLVDGDQPGVKKLDYSPI